MLFPTVDFAVFFVIVFTGSWMLRPYAKAWRWFLLAASCVFYLDPFNPVATDGSRFFTFNPVVVLLTLGAGLATAAVLKIGFGTVGGRSPADRAQAEALAEAGEVLSVASPRAGASRRVAAGPNPVGPDDPATDPDRLRDDPDLEGELARDLERDPADLGAGDDAARERALAPIVPSTPAACFWVPLVVVAGLFAGNVVVNNAYPERPDQSSRFLFLLLGVAFANQAFAQSVFAALGPHRERTAASRWLVRIAVAFDLFVLGYFKYTNWFLDVFSTIAEKFGLALPLNIILPIAISFFTFQAISYVVDVGRGELRPIPLLDFTVYLTFFAHVVAGPIVRVKEFAPQLNARPDPRFVQSAEAFELIFRGLFKKVVISSFMAAQIVDPVFAAPGAFDRTAVLFAILGYAVQIYADFSGYTDIAIGVALLLGIRFPQNFDAPYRSLSLQDFWRRWHMTLSRWLRDYLYIPLGGNRVGYVRTYVNLFLTMLLGGLWHGANWTFLIWGAIHGVGLGLERFVKERWSGSHGVPRVVVGVLQWILTFSIVCGAWVFFRATSIPNALEMFSQLLHGSTNLGGTSRVTWVLVTVIVLMIASQFVPPKIPERISIVFANTPPILQVLCAAAGLALINVLGPEGIAPFIYFQF